MNSTHTHPVQQDLVLIGGGHAHIVALSMLVMREMPGVRITLISDGYLTPYSGMLPGFIAGHYNYEDVHIDLSALCRRLGVRFIDARVTSLDLEQKKILSESHPAFHFDVLSIDVGAVPNKEDVSGAQAFSNGVKPVPEFLSFWENLNQKLRRDTANKPLDIAVVGGGASGVEVTLAMQYALKKQHLDNDVRFHILSASSEILPNHNPGVRKRYQQVLNQRGVKVHSTFKVSRIEAGCVYAESEGGLQKSLEVDEIIWATSASAPKWLAATGLACSDKGFVQVNAKLQSVSHPYIFAAGDVADVLDHPRPKAGVFAVRQGKPLAENLYRQLQNKPLKNFTPQQQFLSLVSTGDQFAVASRGNWSIAGAWVWRWKDAIDRKFMRRFQSESKQVNPLKDVAHVESDSMRCGGCGAKVGQSILQRVLAQLSLSENEEVNYKTSIPTGSDDAAVFSVPSEMHMVQSVDGFRRFIEDDYLFGQIAANHALGDLYAMGAQGHSLQVLVTLPFAKEEKVEQQLLHVMKGINKVCKDAAIPIIGGHTAEGHELALGFTVNGLVKPDSALTKAGLCTGDALILTKALGTGVLFAADMRGQAKGAWIKSAINTMLVSNKIASELLRHYPVKACTDVTGFGLAGHLLEMLQASGCRAEIDLSKLPVLTGAIELFTQGYESSLHSQNQQIEQKMRAYIHLTSPSDSSTSLNKLLFDPQTAGGLLASVPQEDVKACIEALHASGYIDTRVIGRVL